jgi:uncharacterized protein (DUF3084 family)
MQNNFSNQHYRDPSESMARQRDMLAGLKEARAELEGGLSDEGQEGLEKESFSLQGPKGAFASQIELYREKIKLEKGRLEKIQMALQEKQAQTNEKLERLMQLEESLEKTKKNLEVIHTEISSFGEFEHEQ